MINIAIGTMTLAMVAYGQVSIFAGYVYATVTGVFLIFVGSIDLYERLVPRD